MAHCFKWSNLMHHLRVDDATRISLIWVAPRIRFHEENFAWDGDNSGACYSRYIACARCWTKSITTSPGTILFRNMAILYTSIFRRKIFSLSLSRIACNYLLEYSNNLFYKYTHFLTNIFTLSQLLTITIIYLFIYPTFDMIFTKFVEITVLLRYFFNEMPIKLTNSSVNQVLHALDLNARILTHCPH